MTSDAFSVEVKCNALKKKKKLAEKSSSSAMQSSNLVEWSSFFFFSFWGRSCWLSPLSQVFILEEESSSVPNSSSAASCLPRQRVRHSCLLRRPRRSYFCLFEMPLIMATHLFTCSMTYKHQWPAVICRLPYSDTYFKFWMSYTFWQDKTRHNVVKIS